MTYTMEDIKKHWAIYNNGFGWRSLLKGRWRFHFTAPEANDGSTRLEMVKIAQYMSFPEYLEKINE